MENDKSGIFSLAGFAYQIKIFVLKIIEMTDGTTLEYETIDDIAINIDADKIDEQEDKLYSVLNAKSRSAIQVKKTYVSDIVAQKILKNWILIDKNNGVMDEYFLVTDRDTAENVFDNIDVNKILKDIHASTGKKSIDSKVKAIGYSDEEILKKISEIIPKIKIEKYEDIDVVIKNHFSDFFIEHAVSQVTYIQRIRQLIEQITVEILQAVMKGKPYIITYDKICNIRNRIIVEMTDEKWEPCFSNFRRLNKVNLSDLAIIKSREYMQLIECTSLSSQDISRHLQFGEYYENAKRGYYERGMCEIVDNIEITAYDNFCDAKLELRNRCIDTPDNRLIETKAKSNSRASDEQIRNGVCIYLTGEETDEDIQISWKDELNG